MLLKLHIDTSSVFNAEAVPLHRTKLTFHYFHSVVHLQKFSNQTSEIEVALPN